MRSFLYFIPGCRKKAVVPADLAAAGLAYAAEGGHGQTCGPTAAGPDGGPGLLVTFNPAAGVNVPAVHKPDEQDWRAGPVDPQTGKPLHWVGVAKAGPPAPDDLARRNPIDGESTAFRDGRKWLVPIARSVFRGSTLPKRMVLGDDLRTWQLSEMGQYLELCRLAEDALEIMQGRKLDASGQPVTGIDYQDGMRLCVAALGLNYRVGPVEVSMLGLTDDDMMAVVDGTCDGPFVRRVLEDREAKKPPAGESSSTDSGSAGTSPATSPRSAS